MNFSRRGLLAGILGAPVAARLPAETLAPPIPPEAAKRETTMGRHAQPLACRCQLMVGSDTLDCDLYHFEVAIEPLETGRIVADFHDGLTLDTIGEWIESRRHVRVGVSKGDLSAVNGPYVITGAMILAPQTYPSRLQLDLRGNRLLVEVPSLDGVYRRFGIVQVPFG